MKALLRLIAASLTLNQAWAEAPESIVAIALNCATCHAENHSPAKGDIPSLGRLTPEQLQQALLAFKSGAKKGTVMPRLAKGYSDQELSALAEYWGRR